MKKYLITFTALVFMGAVGLVTFNRLKADKVQPVDQSEVLSQQVAEPIQESSQVITVEGGSFYYKPNEIKVKVGQKVTLTFNNVDGFHDFVIDELSVRTKQIKAGETQTVEFTPEAVGTYEFYCSVGNHRQMGMKGTLIVE